MLITLICSCSGHADSVLNTKTTRPDTASISIDNTISGNDTIILHPDGYKNISGFYDSSINGIEFNDCDTITRLFGDSFKLLPDNDDLPSLQIINKSKTQLLTMYMWNGNAECDFSQYQVEYCLATLKFLQKPFILPSEKFITSRDICLGITISALKKRIGEPSLIEKDNELIVYSYQQFDDLYFADYYFKNDTLVKFRFGNEYP